MADNSTYRKLPGRAPGVAGTTRLWLGEDHILSVTNTFGVETYRRFYFHTVRSIIFRRTAGRRNWNITFGVVGALLAAVALLFWFGARLGKNTTDDRVAEFFCAAFVSLAVACLVLVLINWLRGPTCNAFAQTAIGMERLGAPVRLNTARRMLEIVAPAIVAAQVRSTPSAAGAPPPPAPDAALAS